MSDDARSWLQNLAARGISVVVRGSGRLHLQPERTAYKALTDDELIFLRHNREAIKAVIADGQAPAPLPADPRVSDKCTTVEVSAGVEPERCRYCGGVCVGPDHHSFAIIHYHDPAEVERRREAQAQRDDFDRRTWHLHDRVQFRI